MTLFCAQRGLSPFEPWATRLPKACCQTFPQWGQVGEPLHVVALRWLALVCESFPQLSIFTDGRDQCGLGSTAVRQDCCGISDTSAYHGTVREGGLNPH